MTEADKQRECERNWNHNHPLRPGTSGPPELGQIKYLFGLAHAEVQSITDITDDSATVTLRNPRNGARRQVRMRLEDDRWQVYELEIGELIGP